MTRKPFIVDSSLYDLDKPVATIDDIRLCNRQRFEMEQLTAVVYDNYEEKASVGYKDVTPEETQTSPATTPAKEADHEQPS